MELFLPFAQKFYIEEDVLLFAQENPDITMDEAYDTINNPFWLIWMLIKSNEINHISQETLCAYIEWSLNRLDSINGVQPLHKNAVNKCKDFKNGQLSRSSLKTELSTLGISGSSIDDWIDLSVTAAIVSLEEMVSAQTVLYTPEQLTSEFTIHANKIRELVPNPFLTFVIPD